MGLVLTKYQKYIACSYGYKLLCVNDKFSKSFKLYICKDAVYSCCHWQYDCKYKKVNILMM